jgi:heme-degrading monooxygenase HmoA
MEVSMLSLRPLDPVVPIEQQLQGTATPVVLVNLFTVAEADIPALMAAWEKDAHRMKRQPGFLSTQLHRAIGGSCLFMNYAVWETVNHFRAAFTHPDFVRALDAYPSSAVATPHLFSKVAVPNLCTA